MPTPSFVQHRRGHDINTKMTHKSTQAITGSIIPLASAESIDVDVIARLDAEHLFLIFCRTSSCWANGRNLLRKILISKNLLGYQRVLCLIYCCSV